MRRKEKQRNRRACVSSVLGPPRVFHQSRPWLEFQVDERAFLVKSQRKGCDIFSERWRKAYAPLSGEMARRRRRAKLSDEDVRLSRSSDKTDIATPPAANFFVAKLCCRRRLAGQQPITELQCISPAEILRRWADTPYRIGTRWSMAGL